MPSPIRLGVSHSHAASFQYNRFIWHQQSLLKANCMQMHVFCQLLKNSGDGRAGRTHSYYRRPTLTHKIAATERGSRDILMINGLFCCPLFQASTK